MAAVKKQNVLPSPVFVMHKPSFFSSIPAAISIRQSCGTMGNSRTVAVRLTTSPILALSDPSHQSCSFSTSIGSNNPPEHTLFTRTSPISFE